MARASLERLLDAGFVDELFAQTARKQYTRELLFSTLMELLAEVVLGRQPSVHAAYQARSDEIPVSITAVYDKLKHVEPSTCEALVAASHDRALPLVRELAGVRRKIVPGYQVRILDGNTPPATEHRLAELRGTWSAPLPGKAVVVYAPAENLIRQVFLTPDGHQQERSLIPRVLEVVRSGELWIADRQYCTLHMLSGLARRKACFVIRQHGTMPVRLLEKRRRVGRSETGMVFEQACVINDPETGVEWELRRITVELNQPTRDGDRELHLLSNVPSTRATALVLAAAYRDRWQIERVFFEIERAFESEPSTLAYPQAALFALSLGFLVYNALAVVQAAIEAAHGSAAAAKVSCYYLSLEIRQAWDGLQVAVPAKHWRVFATLGDDEFATQLRAMAAYMNLARYRKHPRGPKNKAGPHNNYANGGHVSTAKILRQRKAP